MTALATKLLVIMMAFASWVRLNCGRGVDCDRTVALWFNRGFLRVFYCFGNCFRAGVICRDIADHIQYYKENCSETLKNNDQDEAGSNDTEKGGFCQAWY